MLCIYRFNDGLFFFFYLASAMPKRLAAADFDITC
jgi:hypothetical protein